MLKFQILLFNSVFPFSKKDWWHRLHSLYTVAVFTAEFGFTIIIIIIIIITLFKGDKNTNVIQAISNKIAAISIEKR